MKGEKEPAKKQPLVENLKRRESNFLERLSSLSNRDKLLVFGGIALAAIIISL